MNYIKIEKQSIANGNGIRVVLWVSGCTCNCTNCQNPQTWDFNAGTPFDDKAKQELFEALNKPYIQGITFSGGHPLENQNAETIFELITEIRARLPSKDIWLYTGYVWEQLFPPVATDELDTYKILRQFIVKNIDVLVDGKFVEELKDINLKWCGSSNQRVIDVKKTLKRKEVCLWEK